MKRGIKVPMELSYSNRLKHELMAKVLYNKEIKSTDTNRYYAYIIIPDFGLYGFSDH